MTFKGQMLGNGWLSAVRRLAILASMFSALLFLGEAHAAPTAMKSTSVTAGLGAVKTTGLKLASTLYGYQTSMTVTDSDVATEDDYRLIKTGMTIWIDQEQMKVTGVQDVSGTTTATLARGQAGTSAVDHATGKDVYGNYIKVPIAVTDVTFRNGGTVAASFGTQTTQNSGTTLMDTVTTACTTIPMVGCQSTLNVTNSQNLIANSIATIDAEQMAIIDVTDSAGDGYTGSEELLLGSNPASLVSIPESLYFGSVCGDGADNDGDGLIDLADPTCSPTDSDMVVGVDQFPDVLELALGSNPNSSASTPENRVIYGRCTDGLDNDGDGQMDGADTGCDAVDGDNDGFTGTYERAFNANPGVTANTPETVIAGGTCSDTIDNDGDGQTDAADAGCSATDSDGDGFTNPVETALGSSTSNGTRKPEHSVIIDTCDDAIDNDGDGVTDADDPGCNSLDVDPDTLTVLRAVNGTTNVGHSANAVVNENALDLSVSDQTLVGVSSTIKIDNEQMLVLRTREGLPDVLEVKRAQNGTTVASHANGAAISDIDGLGSFDFTINVDITKANLIRTELDPTGGFLQSTGRVPTCTENLGVFENSGTTLSNGVGTTETVIDVGDQSLFRIGGMIKIDAEQMIVKGTTEGTPDKLTVQRPIGQIPPDPTLAPHAPGAIIYGQNLVTGGFRMSCVTSGPTPLGPTGSAAPYPVGLAQALARVVLMPTVSTMVPNPAIPQTLTGVSLTDVSGDGIPTTTTNGTLVVYKCPDIQPFNGNPKDGVANSGDLLNLARAVYLGAPTYPPNPANHDINGDGAVNTSDTLAANRIVQLAESTVFCRPI